jgi:hypothetical protein
MLLNTFGSDDGWASFQPPPGKDLYRCPTCHRYGWARHRPMCKGSAVDEHPRTWTERAPNTEGASVDPNDLPVFE